MRPFDGRSAVLAAGLIVAVASAGVVGGVVGAQLATQQLQQQQASATTAPAATSTPAATDAPASGAASAPGTTSSTTASQVYAAASKSVVHLSLTGGSGRGSGSGFVVDDRGHILTNQHVVAGARTITVRFVSGETRTARVLGTDRANDVALIKVDDMPAGAGVAKLGDSSAVQVGEVVIAIGSPFGLEQTVTQGIVSAVRRTYQTRSGPARTGLIQIDAPINPGNSGGPLLNARAEVIGINSMIESPIEGSVGVGFAVPIDIAKQLLPQLQAGAQIEPVWLGISGLALDDSIAAEAGVSVTSGVLVASVVPGAPADRAGIRGGQGTGAVPRGGDVITALDGVRVTAVTQITERLRGRKPGDVVRLTVVRGTQTLEVPVTLDRWPETTQ